MNNKDLFNAINDIDEKFIEDAGKYLNDDECDDPSQLDSVEIFPGETRFSPIKIIAPIAAAAVLVVGAAAAIKANRNVSIAPNTIGAGSAEGTAGEASGGLYDGFITDTDLANSVTGLSDIGVGDSLPFEVYGPDGRLIKSYDVTEFQTKDGSEVLTAENWKTITCGDFAYVAAPKGNNFNTIDNDPLEITALMNDTISHRFYRISKGDMFGDLIAAEVSSTFERVQETAHFEKNDDQSADIGVLSRNYVRFDGSITADVYIVKDNDRVLYVFRNGENQIPLLSYSIKDYVLDNEYFTVLHTYSGSEGFGYAGELPVPIFDGEETAGLEPYLENNSYLRATVVLSDIEIEGSATGSYSFRCETEKCMFRYFEAVRKLTDNETAICDILYGSEDITKLKELAGEVNKLSPCDEIKVFTGNIISEDGTYGDERSGGSLVPGNVIALYNGGELIGSYKYKETTRS